METSNRLEYFLRGVAVIYNSFILFFSLIWLFTNSFSSWKKSLKVIEAFDVNENVTYGLFLLGVLGGAFYCLRSFYQRLAETYTPAAGVSTKQPMKLKVWIFWYLYRPIEGGVLALVLLVLIKSNLIQLANNDGLVMTSYYTLVGLGFLAGFGAHELIHKILEVIQVLFAKSKLKSSDSL